MSSPQTPLADGEEQCALSHRRRARRRLGIPLGLLLVAGLASAALFRLPYYAVVPGAVLPVDELVAVEEGPSFPPEGRVYMTTVSLRPVTALQAVVGWLDPTTDVVPRNRVIPPAVGPSDFSSYNLQLMDTSKETALLVAFRRLGYDVRVRGSGARVVGVLPASPADGRLRPGEVIVAVDGASVSLAEDAVALIGRHRPGDVVRLSLAGLDGDPPREEVLTLAAHPDHPGSPLVGVSLATEDLVYDLPRAVDIKSQRVGGPSAGLAFALEVIDVLTPGELTGGHEVAATGTIESDGRVGPVGGVAQKALAVERAGIDLFLVPRAEFDHARRAVGEEVQVEPVDDLDDALAALGFAGGDALHRVQPDGGT